MDEDSNSSSEEGAKGSANTSSTGQRKSSFIASLLGRSLSLADDYDSTAMEVDGQTNDPKNPRLNSRHRTHSLCEEDEVDGKNELSKEVRRRTFSLIGNRSSNLFTDNSDVFDTPLASNQEPDIAGSTAVNRETSQTDHLNKRLLSSFLTRINSMATSFIDPSGSGQNVGAAYSDDVVMDRILRQVENSSSSLNKNDN